MMILWKGKKIYVAGWEPNAPVFCQGCGLATNDLRPFGPKGEFYCPQCGEKDKAGTAQRLSEAMDQADLVVNLQCNSRMSKERMTEILDQALPEKLPKLSIQLDNRLLN